MSAQAGIAPAGVGSPLDAGLDWVVLATPDLGGVLRGKALSAAQFAVAARSGASITDLILAVDGVDAPITTSVGVGPGSGSRDLVLWPDPATLVPLPWRPHWAWCLGSPAWPDGRPCDLAPRVVCERAIAALASLGLRMHAAFEYEFRLWDAASGQPMTPGRSYSLGELRGLTDFLDDLRTATAACGIELSALHTEAGPGLVEVNLAPADGVMAADQAALLRACVMEIALQHGMRASFLAKPAVGEEGSGGHLHLSVLDGGGGNVFAGDVRGGETPAAPLRHAIAGLLAHMGALSVVYNPAINSYKRLVPGWFAPVTAAWAIDDRTAAVRVVAGAESESTHLELRRAGADANPHLVLAAAAVSVLSGLEHGVEPPAPVTHGADGYAAGEPLPADLGTALQAFRASGELRERLGAGFCDHFAATREWELRAWQEVVTDWERTRVEGASPALRQDPPDDPGAAR